MQPQQTALSTTPWSEASLGPYQSKRQNHCGAVKGPGNEPAPWPLLGMPNDLRSQISAEIKRVQGEIDQQKQLIKHNIAKKLVVETAEQEMKALPTRLSVLEANLVKETAKPSGT